MSTPPPIPYRPRLLTRPSVPGVPTETTVQRSLVLHAPTIALYKRVSQLQNRHLLQGTARAPRARCFRKEKKNSYNQCTRGMAHPRKKTRIMCPPQHVLHSIRWQTGYIVHRPIVFSKLALLTLVLYIYIYHPREKYEARRNSPYHSRGEHYFLQKKASHPPFRACGEKSRKSPQRSQSKEKSCESAEFEDEKLIEMPSVNQLTSVGKASWRTQLIPSQPTCRLKSGDKNPPPPHVHKRDNTSRNK